MSDHSCACSARGCHEAGSRWGAKRFQAVMSIVSTWWHTAVAERAREAEEWAQSGWSFYSVWEIDSDGNMHSRSPSPLTSLPTGAEEL